MKKGLKIGLIVGTIFLVSGLVLSVMFGSVIFDQQTITTHSHSYTNHEEIHTLVIDSDVSNVKIRRGNTFQIDTYSLPQANEKNKKIDVIQSESEGIYTFKTKYKVKHFRPSDNIEIIVSIPEQVKVVKVNVNVGELEMENVQLDTLEVKADVGDCSFENCIVQTMHCSNNLGDIDFSGDFIQTMDLDSNVGDIEIELDRACDEYKYDVDCKVGKCEMEHASHHHNTNATSTLTCRLDVGDCEIEFRK